MNLEHIRKSRPDSGLSLHVGASLLESGVLGLSTEHTQGVADGSGRVAFGVEHSRGPRCRRAVHEEPWFHGMWLRVWD